MVGITQKFSATLTAIGEAVARGELSSEQAVEMSAEQYQLTQMQFELLSLWREIGEKDSARIPDDQATPDPGQENEIVHPVRAPAIENAFDRSAITVACGRRAADFVCLPW